MAGFAQSYYRYKNGFNLAYTCFVMIGVVVIGLLVAIKLDFISLEKTKLNSIKDSNVELVISTTDATNVSKVYQALKTAKNDVSFLETDIQKVELVDNNTKILVTPKANITNFIHPIEFKIKK